MHGVSHKKQPKFRIHSELYPFHFNNKKWPNCQFLLKIYNMQLALKSAHILAHFDCQRLVQKDSLQGQSDLYPAKKPLNSRPRSIRNPLRLFQLLGPIRVLRALIFEVVTNGPPKSNLLPEWRKKDYRGLTLTYLIPNCM